MDKAEKRSVVWSSICTGVFWGFIGMWHMAALLSWGWRDKTHNTGHSVPLLTEFWEVPKCRPACVDYYHSALWPTLADKELGLLNSTADLHSESSVKGAIGGGAADSTAGSICMVLRAEVNVVPWWAWLRHFFWEASGKSREEEQRLAGGLVLQMRGWVEWIVQRTFLATRTDDTCGKLSFRGSAACQEPITDSRVPTKAGSLESVLLTLWDHLITRASFLWQGGKWGGWLLGKSPKETK